MHVQYHNLAYIAAVYFWTHFHSPITFPIWLVGEKKINPHRCIKLVISFATFTILTIFPIFIQYMDKPPEGKHSTKGLGKNIPLESEYVKWRDDIVVPCGKPVPSKVKASELMYNEYIVYNTAQVSYLFLFSSFLHHWFGKLAICFLLHLSMVANC